MILILEDSSHRINYFRTALNRCAPDLPIHIWSSARTMIAECAPLLSSCRLISLDHDLYAPQVESDPGDGLEVAKFLASQPVMRPVIIHSSNSIRADQMQGEFQLAHWPCTRVLPLGETWIEDDGLFEVRRILEG